MKTQNYMPYICINVFMNYYIYYTCYKLSCAPVSIVALKSIIKELTKKKIY